MISINSELCIACGLCINDCPNSLIRKRRGVVVGPSKCMACGHCASICPKNAITMSDYDMTSAEPIDGEMIISPETMLSMIRSRRSIRSYKTEKIGEDALKLIIEAGRYTATAKNAQANTFVIVQNELDAFKNLVWQNIDEKVGSDPMNLDPAWIDYFLFNMNRKRDPEDDFIFRNAPAVLFIATDNTWDAGLAAQNIEHMATTLQMGVLYDGYLARIVQGSDIIKEWLGISGKQVAVAMLIGYPDVKYQRMAPRRQASFILK